jgi:hypothetical protein
MKIIERSLTKEVIEANDYKDAYAIIVNGKQQISANDYGEPEDNCLGRDLSFVYSIVGLMKMAFEAGKRGEELEITSEEVEEMY